MLSGKFPDVGDLELEPCVVKIYSKSQNERNFGRYLLYAKNEGNVPVTHFDFDVEFSSENGRAPAIDEWYLPNATKTLEQKDSNSWVLHFNVQNINLDPGAIYPNESGFSFGIHYADWSNFDPSDDYAFAEVNADYATKWADNYAKEKKLNNAKNHQADGFRHAVWNALICRETGTQFDDISECIG